MVVASEEDVPDRELVRRISSGADRAAESLLCRRYARRIRLYGLRHLRDEDRARDLVQAVLVIVLEAARASRIEDLEHVERFVLGTSRNVASRMRERDGRLLPVDDIGARVDAIPLDDAHDPDDRLEWSALVRCLSALEARARSVVMLSFQEGRAADEIAALLQTTAGNVRVLRHRAVAALRRCVETNGGAS